MLFLKQPDEDRVSLGHCQRFWKRRWDVAVSALLKVLNRKGDRHKARTAVLRTPAIESVERLTSVACRVCADP